MKKMAVALVKKSGVGARMAALIALGAAFAGMISLAAAAAAPPDRFTAVKVYKSPTCGCCGKWVEHLRAHGFTVTVEEVSDLVGIRSKNGVPSKAASCHTALVDGYVVEGHVPADAILRMLKERPNVVGIGVPGMPIGAPGMEGPKPQPYDVLAFDRQGNTRVYSSR